MCLVLGTQLVGIQAQSFRAKKTGSHKSGFISAKQKKRLRFSNAKFILLSFFLNHLKTRKSFRVEWSHSCCHCCWLKPYSWWYSEPGWIIHVQYISGINDGRDGGGLVQSGWALPCPSIMHDLTFSPVSLIDTGVEHNVRVECVCVRRRFVLEQTKPGPVLSYRTKEYACWHFIYSCNGYNQPDTWITVQSNTSTEPTTVERPGQNGRGRGS